MKNPLIILSALSLLGTPATAQPNKHLARGEALLKGGDVNGALVAFSAAIKQSPKTPAPTISAGSATSASALVARPWPTTRRRCA